MEIDAQGISDRLRSIRLRTFGERGKSRFANELGLSPTTYQQYESSRLPPVDVLIKAAQITGCELTWLLLGESGGQEQPWPPAPWPDPVAARVRELVARRPETAQSLVAFLALIDPAGPPPHLPPDVPRPEANDALGLDGVTGGMVPVLGSTAAGTARFWREVVDDASAVAWGKEADEQFQRLLADSSERSQSTEGRLLRDSSDPHPDSTAALVQFSRPDESGRVEFLSIPGLSQEVPLVAWRIDGDSMTPRYRDGDFVLVSPSKPAVEGAPCVAHQQGQIGVNCKIFKRDGADVLLIPVNEAYPIQRFPASRLERADCVLYSVRLQPRAEQQW